MENISDFRRRVDEALSRIDSSTLEYNEDEFWMVRSHYFTLIYYAEKNRLFNTAIALPLARGIHDGSYRKLPVMRSGKAQRMPYVIHCLTVCKMLSDLWLPLTREEEDIVLAAALCHDMIEGIPFPDHGRELVEVFGLDERVYTTVKQLSKRKDFTLEEEQAYFRGIAENKLAMLIKLADRGHNVTDLYNMSEKKIHEYIEETRTYFLPMCDHAREHYPELADVVEILQDQINCLTKTTETLAERHGRLQRQLMNELNFIREENGALRKLCSELRKGATEL